jgi:nitroreductase
MGQVRQFEGLLSTLHPRKIARMNLDPRLEVFARHRTVRRYKPQPLEPGHLEQIMWCAQRAPTDATAQMYSFVRLTDPALRERVATITNNAHMATAAETFIVLADVYRLQLLLEARGFEFGEWSAVAVHFGIGDAVLAGQNLLLAAECLGYQGCWIGGVLSAVEEIVALLELPQGVLPFAGLTIGVPDESPPERPRVQPELVWFENTYRASTPADLETALARMAPITARGDWVGSLARYFAKGGTMEAREVSLRATLERQGFSHVGSDLNALYARAQAAGYAEVLVRPGDSGFRAWVDRPDRAHGGSGATPLEALRNAILEAERDASLMNS